MISTWMNDIFLKIQKSVVVSGFAMIFSVNTNSGYIGAIGI